jgi:hypothetical protein
MKKCCGVSLPHIEYCAIKIERRLIFCFKYFFALIRHVSGQICKGNKNRVKNKMNTKVTKW